MSEKLVSLHFPAQPDRLCMVRALVRRAAQFVGCDDELTEQLVIAVNEACMNVIQHAYHDQPTGEMILEIHNNAGSISFHLVDFAEPVDPTTIRPRDLNDLRPGGLGTHFIREIMDKYEMEPLEDDQGNILRMVKKINQATSD